MAKDTKSAGDAWPFEVHKALSRARARLASPRRDMPARRKLRVYAQDPSLGSEDGAIYTVSIPYEKLAPGPVGAPPVSMPWTRGPPFSSAPSASPSASGSPKRWRT